MSTDNEEKVLGWDDEISNDDQGLTFTIVPPGIYDFEIVNLQRGFHQATQHGVLPNCPKAELTVRVRDANGEEVDIKNNLFLHSRCEGMLCQFFRAIGQRKHGEPLRPNWNAVIGSKGRCKVGTRKWKGKNGKDKESNEIKAFLDPQPATTSTPQVQQAAPPASNGGF